MIKMFKNYILNIFIVTIFLISQTVNVNANYSKNEAQKENIAVSIIEQGKRKTVNVAALSMTDVSHEANDVATEGKIEKVVEFIRIGNLGIGVAIGYGVATVSTLLGAVISQIVKLITSSKN